MSFLSRLFWNGELPKIEWLQWLLIAIAIVPPLAVWQMPALAKGFGEAGWNLLCLVLAIRPLSQILPKLGLLRLCMRLRRQLGILTASLLLSHGLSYVIGFGMIPMIFSLEFWKPENNAAYALVGAVCAFILLITSNTVSQKILLRSWKMVQRLAYPLFFLGAVHIVLVSQHYDVLVSVGVILVLWLLAAFRIVLWK